MQALAAWLVARPHNAVLALAVTISLAYLSFISGVVLMLLVLYKGPRRAMVDVLLATVLLAVVAVLIEAPPGAVLIGAAAMWLPSILLGVVLLKSRSLTLTVQITVVVAIVGMIGFYLVVGDPIDFWRGILLEIVDVWRQLGLTEQAELLAGDIDAAAGQMTMVMVLALWLIYTINAVLGYLLYQQIPGETADFGRFRDLSMGRVIAINMALASIVALASGAVWLQNIAFVLFSVFFLQGLAVVHWLYKNGRMPAFGVIAVYVAMPFLNVAWLMGLAVLGYIDNWFPLRRARAT